MCVFIEGIGIAEYRSFGSEMQRIGPFRQINLFIGQNNAGKSNILRFLVEHYGTLVRLARTGRGQSELTDLDKHLGSTSGRARFALGIQPDEARLEPILQRYRPGLNQNHDKCIRAILSSDSLTYDTELAWFDFSSAWEAAPEISPDMKTALRSENVLRSQDWQKLWVALSNKSGGGGIDHHWIPETLRVLNPANLETSVVTLVPAIRQIDDSDVEDDDFSGAGLVDRLAKLQNPDTNREDSKQRFDEINRFLQNVVGNDDATLEIPYSRDRILVKMDDKTLPLASLGTGIHEVIILAAAATVLRRQVLCLEEPEIHLHPTLQRKLLRYLAEHTDNQYFIATHSAHLLNMDDVAVFHVTLENGQSRVRAAIDPMDKAGICADLGYQASDLLQANCIIWVEGPSDRIYLNHWIRSMSDELVEGTHYSIMFYGGRLLAHLTADDPEVDNFISLRRLNRNLVILIDSDKDGARNRINATKRRMRDEIDNGSGFAWITKGREIENYVPQELLREAVKAVHPKAKRLIEDGQFARCLRYEIRQGDVKLADKIKVAHEVVKNSVDLNVLDLQKQMERLVEFIRICNV